jgi:hypothetical protein
MAELLILSGVLGQSLQKKYALFDMFKLWLIGTNLIVNFAFHIVEF